MAFFGLGKKRVDYRALTIATEKFVGQLQGEFGKQLFPDHLLRFHLAVVAGAVFKLGTHCPEKTYVDLAEAIMGQLPEVVIIGDYVTWYKDVACVGHLLMREIDCKVDIKSVGHKAFLAAFKDATVTHRTTFHTLFRFMIESRMQECQRWVSEKVLSNHIALTGIFLGCMYAPAAIDRQVLLSNAAGMLDELHPPHRERFLSDPQLSNRLEIWTITHADDFFRFFESVWLEMRKLD